MMNETEQDPSQIPYRRQVSFVRRGGRLTSGQERALRDLAPEYLITVPRDRAATSVAPNFTADLKTWFGRTAPLTVEIGSGQGHQIVHAAQHAPERDFLALEVFTGGLARTMVLAEEHDVHNLRMIEANAPEVLEHVLPVGSVDELWIFFPDPWHKARHHKRRLITPSFAGLVTQALRPGGLIRLATDWEDYAEQMRDVLDGADGLRRCFDGEWAPRFDGRVLTAFEQKGKDKGREIRDLTYCRDEHDATS